MKQLQQGFTLLEILITLTLGSLLLLTLINLTLSTVKHNDDFNTLTEIQEKTRIAYLLFQKYLNSAGYTGQSTPQHFEAVRVNNNRLVVQGGQGVFGEITQAMTDLIHLQINSNHPIKAGDQLILSNVERAVLATVKSTRTTRQGQRITLIHPLAFRFYPHDEITRYFSYTFFRAKTQRRDHKGQPIYALYTTNAQGRTAEVIDGIDDFQVRYEKDKAVVITLSFAPKSFHREITMRFPLKNPT